MERNNTISQRDKQYSILTMFEQYWVHGRSTNDLDAPVASFQQSDIPVRSDEDNQRLRNGEVQVHELWDDYLTDFQYELACELRALRLMDVQRVDAPTP